MATPGQLTKVLADNLGLTQPTVAQYDRNLVVAGLRNMNGRGPSAAQVTSRDAAALITSVLAADRVKDAVMGLTRYSEVAVSSGTWSASTIPEMVSLPDDHNFVDALDALIRAGVSGSLEKLMNYKTEGPIGRVMFPWEGQISISALTTKAYGHFSVRAARSFDVKYSIPWSSNVDSEIWAREYSKKLHELGIGHADLQQTRRITAKTILAVASLLRGEPIIDPEEWDAESAPSSVSVVARPAEEAADSGDNPSATE